MATEMPEAKQTNKRRNVPIIYQQDGKTSRILAGIQVDLPQGMKRKPTGKAAAATQTMTQFEMGFVESPSKSRFIAKLDCRIDYEVLSGISESQPAASTQPSGRLRNKG